MTRIFIISLTASLVALWVVTAKANGWDGNRFDPSATVVYANAPSYPPASAWPLTNHEPAISKSLSQLYAVAPAPDQGTEYQYEWQRQPAPTPPHLAVPQQFSYPQQGYFPREGEVPQAPGYEYDFGGAGSYPPMTPMEGASWAAPRTAAATSPGHAPQPFAHPSGAETHIGCLHW